jgi:flagellar hook-length control protein FliK
MIEIHASTALTSQPNELSAVRPATDNGFKSFLDSLGAAARNVPVTASPADDLKHPVMDASKEPLQRVERGIQMTSKAPATSAPLNRTAQTKQGASKVSVQPDQDSQPVKETVNAPSSSTPKQVVNATADDDVEDVDDVQLNGTQEEPEDWTSKVVESLAYLGIKVDPQALAQLPPQETRELEVALRVGVKGLSEGQALPEVAHTVKELLPVGLENQDTLAPIVPAMAPNFELATATAPIAKVPNQEIQRLANRLGELANPVQVSITDTYKEISLAPAAGTQASVSQMTQELFTAVKPNGAAVKAEPNPLFRMDGLNNQIARTEATATAEVKTSYRPTGAASAVLAHQVYDEIQLRPGMDAREMSLKLWPRELGEVSVQVKVHDGERVDAKIQVQSEGVKQALQEHIAVLRENLSRQGLELGQLSVTVGDGQSQQQQQQEQARRGRGKPGSRGWETGVFESTATVQAGADTGRRNGLNSIDVLT